MDLVSNKLDHPMDPIVKIIQEKSYGSSKEKSLGRVISQESSAVEVLHIDFIFGDQPLRISDCDQVMQILQLIIQLSVQAKSDHQLLQYLQSTSSWRNGSIKMSNPCKEIKDR